MGSFYHAVPQNRGVVMSPIQSEKKRLRNEPVYSFTWFDVIVVLVSMGTYLADIITDILVTLVYWKLDEKIWAGLTVTFLIVPSIIMQVFSTRWYVADGHKATFSMFFIHIFMMGPIKRYIAVLKYGIRAKRTKRIEDYQAMYSELSDVSMLRLFESFLESAPQLVLQLYIMIKVTEDDHILTGIAAFFSLISLAWAIAAYTKALRTAAYSQDNRKKRVSWSGLALQTLWRVGMVSGRILALVLFATAYPVWLLAGVGSHWLVMTIWLVAQDTDFCGSWWEERLFNIVVGVIHIFCFFNMKEGRSRWRMMFFYMITFIENSAMIILWFPQRTSGTWYNIPALIVVWGGFVIGLTSMLLYYRYFHPSSPKKCHCCMLYYHLVYRCCPCHDVTAFNGTPYKRNVNAEQSLSDFEHENSESNDLYEFYAAQGQNREFGEERAHENYDYEDYKTPDSVQMMYGKDFDDFGPQKGRKIREFPGGNTDRNRKKDKRKLVMPKPKLTSTPGDDLDEKFARNPRKNHGDLHENDEAMTLTSFSRASERDKDSANESGQDGFNPEDQNIDSMDLFVTTPKALKNLPGAQMGPCANKGNSTLVRDWVKKTQDMYSAGDTNDQGSEVEGHGTDIGTLRFAKKDEREFIEMHFGDFGAHPSGRRDILRLKSFNKKDRQQPPKHGRKRRRSSYNITDLRNTFREAFGFHTIGTSAQESEESAHGKIVRKQPSTKRHSWRQTELDNYPALEKTEGPKQVVSVQNEAKRIPKGRKRLDKNAKAVNMVLARIDQPPQAIEMQNLRPTAKKKNSGDSNMTKICNPVVSEDWKVTELQVDMENLHGTATSSQENLAPNEFSDPWNHITVFELQEPDVLLHPKDFIDEKTAVPLELDPQPSKKAWKISELDDRADSNTEASKKSHRIKWKKPDRSPNANHKRHDPKTEQQDYKANLCDADRGAISGEMPHGTCDHDDLLTDAEIQGQNEPSPEVFQPLVEKSVYDNLTASVLLQPDEEGVGTCEDGATGLETGAQNNNLGPSASPKDVFGPVIQIRGDRVTVKHRNEAVSDTEIISNPVSRIDGHNEPKLTSKPVNHDTRNQHKVTSNLENQTQPCIKKAENSKQENNVAARRDRIEYLYKMGRQGLKKAAQDSPARKRLSFKIFTQFLDDYQAPENSNRDKNNPISEQKSIRNSKKVTESSKNGENCAKSDPRNEMKKSIEALGTSMEGMVDGGENYKIHIHNKSPRRKIENLGARRKREKSTGPKRRTLGAIENI